MLTKTNIGTDENGNPRWHYHSDGHVVLTGPITGTVTTADGTVYDVTEPVTEVHPDHAQEVLDLVGDRYAAEGHPNHRDGTPFEHVKTQRKGSK